MKLLSIDPGTEQSALVKLCDGAVVAADILSNDAILEELRGSFVGADHLVLEEIASYGMPVGREVFATCVWTGRFIGAWEEAWNGASWSMLPRRDVKLTLCGSMKAKDSNIRAALLDRYGGKAATKKGGPLYGIRSHCWSALALAVTYQEQQKHREVA